MSDEGPERDGKSLEWTQRLVVDVSNTSGLIILVSLMTARHSLRHDLLCRGSCSYNQPYVLDLVGVSALSFVNNHLLKDNLTDK